MSISRDARWYLPLYAICIVVMSLQTMLGAQTYSDHHFWLAAVEIVAVLALLVRRTRRPGLWVLLGVYALATVITAHMGHNPAPLVLYAASAVLAVRVAESEESAKGLI